MSAIIKSVSEGLRSMQEDDLGEIMEIETATYDFPWTRTIFFDCLQVGYHCHVYVQQNRIQAYSVMSTGGGEAHVLSLVVRETARNEGLGRKMMLNMIAEARRKGCDTIFLEVRPSNAAALHLYDKMGFNEIGIRRGYYPSREGREDAVIMAYTI